MNEEIKKNIPEELNEEQLNQVAGGNHFVFCCGVCLTPLKCEMVDGALIGFCPTCKCYPENWKPVENN